PSTVNGLPRGSTTDRRSKMVAQWHALPSPQILRMRPSGFNRGLHAGKSAEPTPDGSRCRPSIRPSSDAETDGGRRQSRSGRGEIDFRGLGTGLDKDDAVAVEGVSRVGPVGVVVGGVAVADAEDSPAAGQVKGHPPVG